MASEGYWDWLSAGQPYTLILPAKHVQAAIAAHGITVWDRPNQAHLKAETPEDHTPFSVTGWPGPNARWFARGLDIMPRSDSYAHRKENADIARQLIRDRDAGHPGARWIKYLNWTDEAGAVRQERWMDRDRPNARTTRSSTDAGHIHVSGRSDMDSYTGAVGYDPVARMKGEDSMGNTWTFVDQPATDQWRISQNAGAPYLTGQARDTVLAIAAARANDSAANSAEGLALLRVIAQKVDIDPAELEQIKAAAAAGAREALIAQADMLAAQVISVIREELEAGVQPTPGQIEAAIRRVFADAGQADQA
jgi:hypothetical protein